MIQAYVLVQTDVGAGAQVARQAGSVPGVTVSQMVTGPYDVIARAEATDMDTLSGLIDQVQAIGGVTRTLTCPVLKI
jgi:DNA-binding Lrp family transcriptional regulator